jgi:hypothetical protein
MLDDQPTASCLVLGIFALVVVLCCYELGKVCIRAIAWLFRCEKEMCDE